VPRIWPTMTLDFQLVRTGLWQWSKGIGLERFELLQGKDEWILRGTIITLSDRGPEQAAPAEARYEVVCDGAWRTRKASIAVREAGEERTLQIMAEDGIWYENGVLNQAVSGSVDIDLGWSPSTNTLPIRRLHLKVGEASGEITAAWVQFPDLKLQPLAQEYLRISDRQYRYSSRGGAFVAQISVDDQGLVVDYEGFWRRVKQA